MATIASSAGAERTTGPLSRNAAGFAGAAAIVRSPAPIPFAAFATTVSPVAVRGVNRSSAGVPATGTGRAGRAAIVRSPVPMRSTELPKTVSPLDARSCNRVPAGTAATRTGSTADRVARTARCATSGPTAGVAGSGPMAALVGVADGVTCAGAGGSALVFAAGTDASRTRSGKSPPAYCGAVSMCATDNATPATNRATRATPA